MLRGRSSRLDSALRLSSRCAVHAPKRYGSASTGDERRAAAGSRWPAIDERFAVTERSRRSARRCAAIPRPSAQRMRFHGQPVGVSLTASEAAAAGADGRWVKGSGRGSSAHGRLTRSASRSPRKAPVGAAAHAGGRVNGRNVPLDCGRRGAMRAATGEMANPKAAHSVGCAARKPGILTARETDVSR